MGCFVLFLVFFEGVFYVVWVYDLSSPILNLKLCFGLRLELPSSSFIYRSGMISSFNHSNDGVECNFIFSFHSGIINSKKIAKIIDAVSVSKISKWHEWNDNVKSKNIAKTKRMRWAWIEHATFRSSVWRSPNWAIPAMVPSPVFTYLISLTWAWHSPPQFRCQVIEVKVAKNGNSTFGLSIAHLLPFLLKIWNNKRIKTIVRGLLKCGRDSYKAKITNR